MKVLCLRRTAIGDLVVTTPIYRALHEQLGAEVHVLTTRIPGQMLIGNPHVKEIHMWNDQDMEAKMQALDVDLVVDLHCNLRSHKLRLKLGKPSVGYHKRNLGKRLLALGVDVFGDQHLVDRYFEAYKLLGIQNDGKGLDYFLQIEEELSAKRKLEEAFEAEPPAFFALVLAATHATKRIPAELAVDIINSIEKPVVLLGGKDVKNLAREVMSNCHGLGVVNFVDALPIRESIAVLAKAEAVITPDTGLMHVAAALKLGIVTVWGNTAPPYGMFPYVPAFAKTGIAYAQVPDLSCQPCSRIGFEQCPKGHFKCMKNQDGAAIADQAFRVAEDKKSRSAA